MGPEAGDEYRWNSSRTGAGIILICMASGVFRLFESGFAVKASTTTPFSRALATSEYLMRLEHVYFQLPAEARPAGRLSARSARLLGRSFGML